MNLSLDEVRADVAAFADDDQEVVVERTGEAVFIRGGQEVSFRVALGDGETTMVESEGEVLTYRQFLTHHLARLDVLAARILEKRPTVEPYVDGNAVLESVSEGRLEGRGLELLEVCCAKSPPFSSRVVFITADAGHGKTALLREYQAKQARRFLAGTTSYLFWHVDLQGRQLLRLSEALMGDLGDLRVAGLWMPAIIRLLRHRALVLAIDGFDELAAEQGSTDALGALSVLVQQMSDSGTIVAASRRTFFDTDDYIRRAGLFRHGAAAESDFDQLELSDWGENEAVDYLRRIEIAGKRFSSPEEVYGSIAAELADPAHPMLTRPFLLTHVAKALLRYQTTASEFIRGMSDPLKGVGAVVEAFVKREVSEKWKQKETGDPFLDEEQHFRLLADVAEEMFRAQRDRLDVEVIETITMLLLDEWEIDPTLRQQILQMVRMHVLLTPPSDGDYRFRSFDHPEFRDWFTAYALRDQLVRTAAGEVTTLSELLSVAQISDATAKYACALLPRDRELVTRIAETVVGYVTKEWRPTYLQTNVGTLLPFLLSGLPFDELMIIDAPAVYTSLVFEGGQLTNVEFRNGTFVNTSFQRVSWDHVSFANCEFADVQFDAGANYKEVVVRSCKIDGVTVLHDADEDSREFAPHRIAQALNTIGIAVVTGEELSEGRVDETPVETEMRRLVRRLLGMYRRTTIIPEATLQQRFGGNAGRVKDDVIPLLLRHGVIEEKKWRGSGRQEAWSLTQSLERVLRADGDSNNPLSSLWDELDASG